MKKVKIKSAKELLPLLREGKLDIKSSDCGQFSQLIYMPGGPDGTFYTYLPYRFDEELIVVNYHTQHVHENVLKMCSVLFEEISE